MPMTLCEYSAWITVDDNELAQYPTEVSSDGKKVSCWIASEAGKKFSVHLTAPESSRATAISAYVKVDGINCGGKIRAPSHSRSIRVSGFSTSRTTIRPFAFAHLDLTDDDTFLDQHVSRDLGNITIKVWVIIEGIDDRKREQAPDQLKVHERSKKAISHHVKLEAEVPCTYQPTYKTRFLDKKPLVAFVFKYRQLELLQTNGISPLKKGIKRVASDQPNDIEEEPHAVEDIYNDEQKATRIKALEVSEP